jgi:16S rRNA processing protein RimM
MKLIPVGQVVAPHGIRGEVKFRYYNETGSASLQYRSFFTRDAAGKQIELTATRIQRQRNVFIIQFRGMESVEDVQFLLKKELSVREEDLAPLGDDEYYDYQLIGLAVATDRGRPVGRVKDVMHTGAHDILVIDGPMELLVPMTEAHIVSIRIEEGTVTVKEEALAE